MAWRVGLIGLGLALAACGSDDTPKEPSNQQGDEPAASVAPPATAKTPAPETLVTGTNPLLDSGAPAVALYDITLGATAEQARQVLKAAAAKGLSSYRETADLLSLDGQRHLSSITAEGSDSQERAGVLLVAPPNAPQVWYVGRLSMYEQGKGPSVAAVRQSLAGRFGPPHITQGADHAPTWVWMWSATGQPVDERTGYQCIAGAVVGAPLGDPPRNDAAARHSLPGAFNGLIDRPPACAKIVKAQVQATDGLVTDLRVGASDFALARAAMERTVAYTAAARARAQGEAVKAGDARKPDL